MKTIRLRKIIIFVCLIQFVVAGNEESGKLNEQTGTHFKVTENIKITRSETIAEVLEANDLLEATTPKPIRSSDTEETTQDRVGVEDTEVIEGSCTTPAATEEFIATPIAEDNTTKPAAEVEVSASTTPTVEGSTTTPAATIGSTITQAADESPTTPAAMQEVTTPLSIQLENYAMKQVEFILNHILNSLYLFVSQVLQESDNYVYQRGKLKRYTEYLYRLLHDDDDTDYEIVYTQEESYKLIVKKLDFLQGKSTRFLHKYLPEQRIQEYKNFKEEISTWLDKTGEQMRMKFNYYVSDEDDHVKYLYFNESFDDIPRANEIHQKLWILGDLLKIATNKKQISFMDLYMQS